jgi:hypothetical protein
MNGFIRTLAYGLAALCLLMLASLVSALVVLKRDGSLSPQVLRNLVLSDEEKTYIEGMRHRPTEPADGPMQDQNSPTEEQMLGELADMANASHVSQLVTKLRRQQMALDERQAYLDQQWADIQLARTGLERTQRQLQEQDQRTTQMAQQQELERARWAAAQASEAQRLQVVGEVEKARYRDQAKLFEQMKDAAWASLRRFDARDIARYLALMEPKKAARLLILAQADNEYPNLATSVSKEMLHLDLDNASGDQSERLASLYSFMPAEQVMPFLRDSSAEDIAGILRAMAKGGQVKHRADLMEALRKQDGKREMEVRRILEQPGPQAEQGAPALGAPAKGTAQ